MFWASGLEKNMWFGLFLLILLFISFGKGKAEIIRERKQEEEERRKKKNKKMIYRKWSLLTGPTAILGGIVGAIVVSTFFIDNPYLKPEKKKPDNQPSTK